ncbi:hypothetical protein RJ639_016920 [Escallonia herrerae]|uniref:RING-type domain-containing protein n=1 Tax=Escallonia herrerae TaxID=1293975 RepID=A0AA89ALP1_9ASTE|nr:hypothetical protein RJ639_016920 [Escallonia herrerae]
MSTATANPLSATKNIATGATCAICQRLMAAEDGGDRLSHLPCGHSFHEGCVLEWLPLCSTCPLCRLMLATPERRRLFPSESYPGSRLFSELPPTVGPPSSLKMRIEVA